MKTLAFIIIYTYSRYDSIGEFFQEEGSVGFIAKTVGLLRNHGVGQCYSVRVCRRGMQHVPQ